MLLDRWVKRGEFRLFAREQPGEGPATVLMHGFPDNHHLYDRLVPHLSERHVVVFDFLGWGASDKPTDHEYTLANQVGDLDAVVTGLGLDEVLLVPHDASGPAAINWALEHQHQVAAIVALNTFYSLTADSPPNPPEAIRLFSDPAFGRLTHHFARSPAQFRWLYDFQVGAFIRTPAVRDEFVPLLYRQFEERPSTVGPFLSLNADLNAAMLANTDRHSALRGFTRPVRFAFGEHDPYLSPNHAEELAALFPRAEVTTIPGAGHFPSSTRPHSSPSGSSARSPDCPSHGTLSTGGPGAVDPIEAGDRASRALARVQGMLGMDGVRVPEWPGGRGPGERVGLVTVAASGVTEPLCARRRRSTPRRCRSRWSTTSAAPWRWEAGAR